ncbi:MAG: sugar ABC transporter substrate-binding protein [Eubacterium sp.]|nr:sugar ABC transporter substrate-binding protein [Eubacterium sp.]
MKLKKILTGFFAACMVMSLAACGGNTGSSASSTGTSSSRSSAAAEAPSGSSAADTSDSKAASGDEIKIGISCCLMQNEFFSEQLSYFDKIAKEKYPNVEILGPLDANLDAQKDLDNVAVFKSQGADLIIISLSDFNGAPEILAAAGDIPVVFTNRQPTDMSVLPEGKSCYVGTNETDMGYIMGQYLAEQVKESGAEEINYLNLIGELTAQNAIQRYEGAIQALEESGLPTNCQLEDNCSWDRTEGLQKTQQVLGSGKNVNCVIAGCDEIALGSVEALKAAGVDMDQVAVGGVDGIAAAFDSISKNEMDCTAIQIAYDQADIALDAAMKILDGNLTESLFEISPELVTKDNIADYM